MKRSVIVALALLAFGTLAGCEGDSGKGLNYDFEGAWRFTYTVTSNGGAYPAPVGGQFSETVRIREDDEEISLSFENRVVLEGTADRVDGTFEASDSGSYGDPMDPTEWEIEYSGSAVDELTMRGTSLITVGTATSTATWVAVLQMR